MSWSPEMAAPRPRSPLQRPVPWVGDELAARPGGQHALSTEDIAEIDAALHTAHDVEWCALSPATFPLPVLGMAVRTIGRELSDGGGVVRLSGLPVARYTDAQLRIICLGVSSHLGVPTVQNGGRGLLRDIRDRSREGGQRVDSKEALNWHNDRTDIVGLLCVREAAAGGNSRLASVAAIHNAMLVRCPDLLDVLFQDFNRHAPGDEVGGTESCHALPVFRMEEERILTHYSRTYIEQAARLPGAAPLSDMQRRALDALVALADELAYEMTLRSGEMQFLNNHAILHSRTAFEDDEARGAQRLLLRVWIATGGQGIWDA